SSRLFHEVREKRGLAYYVRSASDHYQDCGSLVSLAGVDPKRVEEAVRVMVDEYRKIAHPKSEGDGHISKEELKKAKEFIKGHLVLELEDSRAVASFYAAQELLEEGIDNTEEILAKIDKVTIEEVQKVGRRYFKNQNLNLALIGDFPDGQKFEKLLEL
ncbi:MAG: insulinase family protein, partial [Candidatus Levybacteria bacterium]|nr:insulinase family protein [Candidatus Levybacteria bacterium]